MGIYLSKRATRRPWSRTRNILAYGCGVVLVVVALILAALIGLFGMSLIVGL